MTTATKKRRPARPATVTDKAQERRPKQGSTVCGASRNASGTLLVCTLPLHHGGEQHEDDAGRRWRRSSGDEEAA